MPHRIAAAGNVGTPFFVMATMMAAMLVASHSDMEAAEVRSPEPSIVCHQDLGRIVCALQFVWDENSSRFCLKSTDEHGSQVCFTGDGYAGTSVAPEVFEEKQRILREELARRAEEARRRWHGDASQ